MKKTIVRLSLLVLFVFTSCSEGNNENNLNECIGDVILTSQSEINEFGNRGCTIIKGSLIINDSHESDITGTIDIVDLSPLNLIEQIEGNFYIGYNPILPTLDSFKNLKKINGSLSIESNERITEINDFNNLKNIGVALSIWANNSLEKIIGFNNLTRTAENGEAIFQANFDISANDQLIEINGFNRLEYISSLFIQNDTLEKMFGFNKLVETKDFWFNNPVNEMNAFNSLELVSGDFDFLDTKILSFKDFSSLSLIKGNVWIEGNHELINLDGLNNLTTVGGDFEIGRFSGNDSLVDLTGLENLNNVGGDFEISFNDNLLNLSGLSGITTSNNFDINYNDNLTSLNGLNNLTVINGNLRIGSNKALTEISGLSKLQQVSEYIQINWNASLKDYCSLTNLIQNNGIGSSFFRVNNNGYNPTYNDMINNNCKI